MSFHHHPRRRERDNDSEQAEQNACLHHPEIHETPACEFSERVPRRKEIKPRLDHSERKYADKNRGD
jgi:hypothetical protein